MNTWKNNNVLTRIKESYFLEDADNKKSGLPTDAKPVGGTIFYIDDTADGTYEFFDASGNPIENVQVGDRPYAYRVIEKGSEDKYYVYHDEIYDNLRWTYHKGKEYVYRSMGTSESIGSGKTNTEAVMAKGIGAHIASDSNGLPTIWYQLQKTRNAGAGGCDDWFVPSKSEVEKLRLAIKSGSITKGIIAGSSYNTSVFMSRYLRSSSEVSSRHTWYWDYITQSWQYDTKNNRNSVLFTRAF